MTYSATASAEEANNLTPQPRVLVISHNVFSASGNMGKTMESLLGGVEPEHLAQLYFHSEVPTRRCCLRYFRVTDRDMLRSVPLRRPVGRAYGPDDIDQGRAVSRTDQGLGLPVFPAAYSAYLPSAGSAVALRPLGYSGAAGLDSVVSAGCDLLFRRRLYLFLPQCLPHSAAIWHPDADVVL